MKLAFVVLLLVAGVSAGGCRHHEKSQACNQTCGFQECAFPRVFSPLYEGGTCVCQFETAAEALVNLFNTLSSSTSAFNANPSNPTSPVAAGLLLAEPGGINTLSSSEITLTSTGFGPGTIVGLIPEVSIAFQRFFVGTCFADAFRSGVFAAIGGGGGFRPGQPTTPVDPVAAFLNAFPCDWDVVACAFIPRCNDGFVYSTIYQQCICDESNIKCVKDCQLLCEKDDSPKGDEEKKDCKEKCKLFIDPNTCQCVKECMNSTINCAYGYAFDAFSCSCKKTVCQDNPQCGPFTHFDESQCGCVASQFCDGPVVCDLGFHYDSTQCCCVADPCPNGEAFDSSTNMCITGNDCSSVPCPGNAMSNGTFPDCTCICTSPDQFFNTTSGLCQCITVSPCNPNITVFDPETCSCVCNPNVECTAPLVQDPFTCSCACPAVFANPCTSSGGTPDPISCICNCPATPTVSVRGPNNGCTTGCRQLETCPAGQYFNEITGCGCQFLACPDGSSINGTFNGPGNFTCPTGDVVSPCTCACVPSDCPVLVCPARTTPDFFTCTCVPINPCPTTMCFDGSTPMFVAGICTCPAPPA